MSTREVDCILKKNKDLEHNNNSTAVRETQISNEEKIPILQTNAENNSNSDYSTVSKTVASLLITENTTPFDLWKGLLFMFVSCIFKSLFSILSKYALRDKADLSSFQLLTYRSYFMLWMTILIVSLFPINVFSEQFVTRSKMPYVIIRTIFAIISMSIVIFAIKYMHISDVYSIYYVYPGFIILLSLIFLKREKIGILDFFCLTACIIGAVLIVKPEFIFHQKGSSSNLHFFGLVLIAALLKAFEDVLVRNVGKEAHFLIFPFMYSIFGMVLFPIPMILFDKVYPKFTFWEVIIVFLIGACTFSYQAFMALGLQNESASRVSMVNYVQIALMFISDLAFFDKTFSFLDLLGTMLIFGFNFANGLYKVYKRWIELHTQRNNSHNN